MRQLTVLLILIFSATCTFAQADGKKNTVYVNLTNPLIFGSKAFVIGYERVLTKNQSFTFNIGRNSLPAFGGSGSDSLKLEKNLNDKGFHISADYRFYLAKENKHDAPHGVYVGPYYSYNSFSRSNQWLLNSESFDGTVNTNTSLSINTVGVQLGYQFIFWKKLAVDFMLLGPGMGAYKIKAELNTTLSADEEALFFDKLNGYLQDKIPGYNLVIDEGEFQKNGSVKTTTLGYRYMINVGFRF